MKLFAGFHDSDLVKITYEESGDGSKTARAVFDNSGWFGIAELCFEGVQYLRIVPPEESYMTEILSAQKTPSSLTSSVADKISVM